MDREVPIRTEERAALHRQLLEKARQAMENAWCPESQFAVGAALLTKSGDIYTGCNVENSNHAGTICAERTAFVKAVSDGHRAFDTVAVVAEKSFECWPCGLCRQFMSDFGRQLTVVVEAADRLVKTATLERLLPAQPSPKSRTGA